MAQRREHVTHEKWHISAQESSCEQTREHRIFSEVTSATVRTEFQIRNNYGQLIFQKHIGYRTGKACPKNNQVRNNKFLSFLSFYIGEFSDPGHLNIDKEQPLFAISIELNLIFRPWR